MDLDEPRVQTGDQTSSIPAAGSPTRDAGFGHVIAQIYDAAVDAERWPAALSACREYVGGLSAAIFAKDITGHRARLYHYDGAIPPEAPSRYFSQYAPIDPSNVVQVMAEPERAIITSRLIDLDEFRQSRFAREWAIPAGIVDMVLAPIEKRGSQATLFGVFLHERHGLGDETAQARVTALAPHIRRAVAIGHALGSARAEADTLREAIDGLAAGVFLVDEDGRLLLANPAGRRLLAEGDVVAPALGDAIRFTGARFRDLLSRGGAASTSTAVTAASGDRYAIHVLPLSGSTRDMGMGRAAAALFVQPAALNPPAIPENLARAFDLTPGELRVTLATVRHDGVPQIAEALGIGEATVRTHLHRIFAKTATKRQADLIKLLAGFQTPLVHH